MQLIDTFCNLGITAIANLQTAFPDGEKFFLPLSRVGDPDYAFSVIFPLLAIISTKLSSEVLAVSLVAEWLNTLLKWILMEHRPYWWVKERELLVDHTYPVLKQTRLSCETGPGSPSGHVMGSTAVLFAIVVSLNEILSKSRKTSHRTKAAVKYILWILFGASIILIAMSRLYTATHFPHQCFLGFLGGLYVAKFLLLDTKMSIWWRNTKRPKLLLAALGMTMISFGAYWLQKGLGIDPQWSVKLAFKWCSKPEWIHVNTTPLFSLVRDCGAAFGIALVSPVSTRYTSLGTSSCIVKGVLIGGVMVAMHLAQAAIPIGHVLTFYLCQFMLYAVQPYIYLVIVPFLATQQKVTNKSD